MTVTVIEPDLEREGDADLGLRERKRLATKNAIQLAALELAQERGIDQVTVDEISHAANISPRTFFNYFRSKDAAIIGQFTAELEDDLVERFVNAGSTESIFRGLGRLVLAVFDGQEINGERNADQWVADVRRVHSLRRCVLKDNPQLFAEHLASMRSLEDLLASIIERRLTVDEPDLAHKPDALQRKARLLTFLSLSVMRHAWWSWADQGGVNSLNECLIQSFADVYDLTRANL